MNKWKLVFEKYDYSCYVSDEGYALYQQVHTNICNRSVLIDIFATEQDAYEYMEDIEMVNKVLKETEEQLNDKGSV